MVTCIACGAPDATVELLPSYDDDAFGIPITIKNAVLRHRYEACGMDGIDIPDSASLEAAVAVARILLPLALSGPDIRFLRKACGLTGKEFAEALSIDNATVSRWEKPVVFGEGHGEVSDRNIREVVWGYLCDRTPAIQVPPAHFLRMKTYRLPDGATAPRLVFERVRLKDSAKRTKSDEWDIYDQAA